MKAIHLACALAVLGALVQPVRADTSPTDVPALGYTPQSMDRAIDPRQDFYRYAAGNWLRRIEIAPSDADAGGFTLLAHQLDRQLLTLIQQAANTSGTTKGSAQQQVGDYYKAAMDDARRDAVGLQPLAADLQRIAAAGSTQADLGSLAGRVQDAYGGSPLINAYAMPDAKNSSTAVLVLVPGAQILEQDEYAKPESQNLRETYRRYIAALLTAAGDAPEVAANRAARILALAGVGSGAFHMNPCITQG